MTEISTMDYTLKFAAQEKEWLKAHGYPYSDDIGVKKSEEKFQSGGNYGVEIPVIHSLKMLEDTIKYLDKYDVYCTRFNETRGSFLLTDQELYDMFALCQERGYGLVIGLGPRPEYDIKASFYRTEFGLEMARQVNNNDAIAFSVYEAVRLAELGCRGLTIYDIGVLRLLNDMRKVGKLPANIKFKTSSHCMASNPLITTILVENGADSVTTAHDCGMSVIQEMRRMNPQTCLDIPTDVYKTKGGYIRWNELTDLVEIASPVMLKMGASAQSHPYDAVTSSISEERVRRVMLGQEYLNRWEHKLKRIGKDDPLCCIPEAYAAQRLFAEKIA